MSPTSYLAAPPRGGLAIVAMRGGPARCIGVAGRSLPGDILPAMNCPKCESEMRSYERNGVTVDQCTGCRGIFLDRGELERLIDAETSFYEKDERPEQRQEKGGEKPRKSKKKSFLENLMELGGE